MGNWIILSVPKTATFVAYVLLRAMDQRDPDPISAITSTEKVKYAFRKATLYRKLQLDVIIISNSRLNDLKGSDIARSSVC